MSLINDLKNRVTSMEVKGKSVASTYTKAPNPEDLLPTLSPAAIRRANFLDVVKGYICKDRNTTYGEPENNFGNIANLWNAYLQAKPNKYITAVDVALMQDLVKTARLASNPTHMDSWHDKAGYSACGGSIMENSLETNQAGSSAMDTKDKDAH